MNVNFSGELDSSLMCVRSKEVEIRKIIFENSHVVISDRLSQATFMHFKTMNKISQFFIKLILSSVN